MSYVTDNRLHRAESDRCQIVDAPDNFHFELRCEDCDVKRMARLSLDGVDDRYRQGRVTREDLEAYTYVWCLLSPYRDAPGPLVDPDLRRIARKLLTARSFPVPAELLD